MNEIPDAATHSFGAKVIADGVAEKAQALLWPGSEAPETVVLARVVQRLRADDVAEDERLGLADDLARVQRAIFARERRVVAAELRELAEAPQVAETPIRERLLYRADELDGR